MKPEFLYLIGAFPVVAIASVFLGNPYLSLLLITAVCIIAIPVSYIAMNHLAHGVKLWWSIISLLRSSTAAIIGVVGMLAVLGDIVT